eukprot:TRINITY_DN12971_c0_g1_i1.p2 TRINITY_DN12971_c0_g1~~TRINITY_DN12971_c0_g1_i1.p2  ORF type:complete len:294 (-),score=80.97 TRINITY_DN12971_c0_g1_i1:48-929(-)
MDAPLLAPKDIESGMPAATATELPQRPLSPRSQPSSNAARMQHWSERIDKGTASNLATFACLVLGILLVWWTKSSLASRYILEFGLFGFAGGITNWLAVEMLFEKIPFLYGSGVIPTRFKEIRETVKNTILKTFFDPVFLERYLSQKADQLKTSSKLQEQLQALLESPAMMETIERQVAGLETRPEGMVFAMMGVPLASLTPVISAFVRGMAQEAVPQLVARLDPMKLVSIETVRNELDALMTTKLQELTPELVKQLLEEVMRKHLGWLVVWGNVFGGLIGIATITVETLLDL